jgi:hypothetical protein
MDAYKPCIRTTAVIDEIPLYLIPKVVHGQIRREGGAESNRQHLPFRGAPRDNHCFFAGAGRQPGDRR